MRIGVTREVRDGETRVAATPTTVASLLGLGYGVVVEPGAGVRSSFTDDAYAHVGATVGEAWACDVVLKVNAPTPDEIARLRPGTTLVALLSPALNPDLLDALAARGVTALALDAVPRISRAQSMDVLSSMANIAGYRAVIEAAHAFGRFFTGQVTAAGKVPPAKVLVAGAGVAVDPATGAPAFDPETCETPVPGLFVAGTVQAGRETHRIFIENSREHAPRIVERLLARRGTSLAPLGVDAVPLSRGSRIS